MAEIILYLKDISDPDPARDLRAWKRGYHLRVEEDGYPWATKESIEAWVAAGNDAADWHGVTAIIKIPGVPKADLDYLLESLTDVIGEATVLVRKRSWRADLTQLPPPILHAIERDYVYTASSSQWNVVLEYLGP